MGIDTGVNLKAAAAINHELRTIREELKELDTYEFPIDFDITNYTLPAHIDNLFEQAILLAQTGKYDSLLDACQSIERYFNFPKPDENVKNAEIPGGMYTNMLAQLKQLKLENLLPRVLEIIPTVRFDAGCPPLVTPTSQIVGAQAVNCAIDESKGLAFLYQQIDTIRKPCKRYLRKNSHAYRPTIPVENCRSGRGNTLRHIKL